MGLHIREFAAAVTNPAKVTHFIVDVPGFEGTGLNIKIQSAQWPGVGSTDMDLFFFGQTIKYPGSVEYDHTWAAQIVETQSGLFYNQIYAWRQLVFNQETSVARPTIAFKRPVTITAMTDEYIPFMAAILEGCYPKTIDPVELDRSNNTEAWKWGLTLSYDWWHKKAV